MKIIFALILLTPFIAYADNADKCLQELFKEPFIEAGMEGGYYTVGRVNGFAYSIQISRNKELDDTEETRAQEIKRLQEKIKKLEQVK